jgi:CRISPR-associated endonuclease/helicase Cas3
LRGKPTTFWGKLRGDSDSTHVVEWHPLVDHCADVAAIAEALLCLPVWRERLIHLAAEDLSESSQARLCVLAALHDIGKFNVGFQAKGRPEFGPTAGHVREALGAFRRATTFACLNELAAWGEATTGLLVSALCHHGRPYNADSAADCLWQASWWLPREGMDPRAGAEDLFSRCRRWFPKAFEPGGSKLPMASAFSHAFAGLVMLADWMGSDTRFFPFTEADDGDRMTLARSRARQAVAAMALDVPLIGRTDARRRPPFLRVASEGYLPRPMQAAVTALPPEQQPSITILEAETGSGKTEAALARFVSLFEAGLVDGLYFALPTRSAATQMHRRVYEATKRAFATPPPVVLAVPGYLRVDDAEGTKLAPFEVLWPDADRFRSRAWAAEAPKRYLVGCVVVGTVDQVLLSALMVGHAHLRASALLRHFLVVDEVHASDAYMARILEEVLAHHLAAGGHAMLLSATLGGEARTRFFRPGELVSPPAFVNAETVPYPFISYRGALERVLPIASDSVERVIQLVTTPCLEDAERLVAEVFAAGMSGAKVLVIRNTVTDCVRTQMAVERLAAANGGRQVLFTCAGVPAPHHALFARRDRQALDIELERRIGKEQRPGGCVVIATQTVQQSLDLDADVLYSDLCPADVLLQRIGRLHRHTRPRPSGFGTARAFVIVPGNRNLGALINQDGTSKNYHGLGRVYPDLRMLEATWRLIEKHSEWRIPTMNRHLVESSVHSEVLDAIASDGGVRWQAHANQMLGARRGQQRQADLNLVDWSKPYSEMSFPSSADQRIVTRLGEGDRRVRFGRSVVGPFGQDLDELVLRAWWVSGVPSDVQFAEDVSTTDSVTFFRFGGRHFVYDRLGLRPDRTLPSDGDDDGP